jgi:predicted RNase H-like nuclease (RuvC/YqgF family)
MSITEENVKLQKQGARLFDKTLELAGENHKLREQMAEWKRVAESKQDIIDHMRDANAENGRLRDRITTQKQTIQAYRDESREWREVAEHAQAENDELRELVADTLMDVHEYAEKYGIEPNYDAVNAHLDNRMRELRGEVNDG